MENFINRYKSASHEIDSNIPNTLFVEALYNLEFASLLILVIILANTFAMEKHYKTYQIRIPTAAGNKKITAAKLCRYIACAWNRTHTISYRIYHVLYVPSTAWSESDLLFPVAGIIEYHSLCIYLSNADCECYAADQYRINGNRLYHYAFFLYHKESFCDSDSTASGDADQRIYRLFQSALARHGD